MKIFEIEFNKSIGRAHDPESSVSINVDYSVKKIQKRGIMGLII